MDGKRLRKMWHKPKASPSMMDGEDAAMVQPPEPQRDFEAEKRREKLLDNPSLAIRQLDRWIASMERLRLADYVRYIDNRKRMFWSNFWGGVARGVGMAVGFTILGAILVLILQDLAKHNLPLIGDTLAQIVSVVQKRLN